MKALNVMTRLFIALLRKETFESIMLILGLYITYYVLQCTVTYVMNTFSWYNVIQI